MLGDILKNLKHLPQVEMVLRRHRAYYDEMKASFAVQISRGIQNHMMTCTDCGDDAVPPRTLSDSDKEKLARLDDLIDRALKARAVILLGEGQ